MFESLEFLDESAYPRETRVRIAARLNEAPLSLAEALQAWTPDADESQRRVIDSSAGDVQIVAAAGTGKTQTLVNVALARTKLGARPQEILFLTFSNAASTSLRMAIDSTLGRLRLTGPDAVSLRELQVLTLNSLGNRLLRQHFPQHSGELADTAYCNRLCWQILEELKRNRQDAALSLPHDVDPVFLREYFSILKGQYLDPRHADPIELAEIIGSETGHRLSQPLMQGITEASVLARTLPTVCWLYREYDRRLRLRGKMDFDDQKLRPFLALHEDSTILQRVQASYKSIIVDEFQDINPLDFELILTIAGPKTRLVVAGDDDQAIYGFRGCTPEYMVHLGDRIGKQVDRHELKTNYRCPPNVLELATKLIGHNCERIPKSPISQVKENASVWIARFASMGQEAQGVSEIVSYLRENDQKLVGSDIAVLFRTHGQSLPIQVQFALDGIPFVLQREDDASGLEFLQRICSLIRFSLNTDQGRPEEWSTFASVLKAYFRVFGTKEVQKLDRLREEGYSVELAIRSHALIKAVPKLEASQFAEALYNLKSAKSPVAFIRVVSKRFRALSYGGSRLMNAILGDSSWDALLELAREATDLAQFLHRIESAVAFMSEQELVKARDQVRLMTYFGAKGLQWHTVILLGCNEGVIPHPKGYPEEERRLFYVGLTRCSANLIISHVAEISGRDAKPSRFIAETGVQERAHRVGEDRGLERLLIEKHPANSLRLGSM
jgi:DNA helicase II / ATP-dependent DNA helicase PcrA